MGMKMAVDTLTPEQLSNAKHVSSELLRLEAEFDALSEESDPRTLAPANIPALQARLAALKADIKAAAKYGTISRKKEPQSNFEQWFFGPAVQQASANFRMAINSNPLTKNWASELYSSRGDISYFRFGLEKYIKAHS
jgi:hypothetical protein